MLLIHLYTGIDHESLKAMTDEFTWSLEAGSPAAPASEYCGGRVRIFIKIFFY